MNSKIMSVSTLDNIVARLNCCHSLLDAVRFYMDGSNPVSEEALFGVSELLEMICRNFQADIDAAEEYTGKAVDAA